MNSKDHNEPIKEETMDRFEWTSVEEFKIIRQDQEAFLYSNHKAHIQGCLDLCACRDDHFDEAVDPMEIAARQRLLKKLLQAKDV